MRLACLPMSIEWNNFMKKNLAKLQKNNLREAWGIEQDFTNWLAQDGLDLLSETIGVDIKLIQIEANVGNFKVDILGEEESSGRKIIIENQLESTNHDHLGKIITYASGYDAKIIIWIVSDVREEHKRAIEWLNEHTDEESGYFLIKVELWQIEDSSPAPNFDVVVSPNEWAKTIKASPSGGELSDTKLQQLDFWTRFRAFFMNKRQDISLQKPWAWNWYPIRIGLGGVYIELSINSIQNTISCEIILRRNIEFFEFLQAREEEIEKEIGEKTEWRRRPITSFIQLKKEVSNIFSQSESENYFIWLYEKTMLFQKVFCKYFKEFQKHL